MTTLQNKPAVRNNPVDFDNKTVSDYAESLVTLMPTNQYSHVVRTIVLNTDVSDDARLECKKRTNTTSTTNTTIEMTMLNKHIYNLIKDRFCNTPSRRR